MSIEIKVNMFIKIIDNGNSNYMKKRLKTFLPYSAQRYKTITRSNFIKTQSASCT